MNEGGHVIKADHRILLSLIAVIVVIDLLFLRLRLYPIGRIEYTFRAFQFILLAFWLALGGWSVVLRLTVTAAAIAGLLFVEGMLRGIPLTWAEWVLVRWNLTGFVGAVLVAYVWRSPRLSLVGRGIARAP